MGGWTPPNKIMRNYRQSGASPETPFYHRTYSGRYQQSNPTLDALVRRREAAEDYRRRFGGIP